MSREQFEEKSDLQPLSETEALIVRIEQNDETETNVVIKEELSSDLSNRLFNALKINTNVKELTLGVNIEGYFKSHGVMPNPTQWKQLAEALMINKNIAKFTFTQKNILEENFKYLVEALKVNKSITDLTIDAYIYKAMVKYYEVASIHNNIIVSRGKHSSEKHMPIAISKALDAQILKNKVLLKRNCQALLVGKEFSPEQFVIMRSQLLTLLDPSRETCEAYFVDNQYGIFAAIKKQEILREVIAGTSLIKDIVANIITGYIEEDIFNDRSNANPNLTYEECENKQGQFKANIVKKIYNLIPGPFTISYGFNFLMAGLASSALNFYGVSYLEQVSFIAAIKNYVRSNFLAIGEENLDEIPTALTMQADFLKLVGSASLVSTAALVVGTAGYVTYNKWQEKVTKSQESELGDKKAIDSHIARVSNSREIGRNINM